MNKKKIYKIAKWCDRCGDCLEACPLGAIIQQGDKYIITDKCDGCGDCIDACPIEAIVEEGENVEFESKGDDESE